MPAPEKKTGQDTLHIHRIWLFILFGLCIWAAFPLAQRLHASILLQFGTEHFKQKRYGLAFSYFQKASQISPDCELIIVKLGDTCLSLGKAEINPDAAGKWFSSARDFFASAFRVNPFSARAAFGAAYSAYLVAGSENAIFPEKQKNLGFSEEYIRKAVTLRPCSPHYQYTAAKIHQLRGNEKQMYIAVQNTAFSYPLFLREMKKEGFWSEEIAAAYEKGLKQAISVPFVRYEAMEALSYVLAEKKKWEQAGFWYEKSLEKIPPDTFRLFRLGMFRLRAGETEKAENNFLQAISLSENKEEYVKKIAYYYGENSDAFFRMYEKAEKRFGFSRPFTLRVMMFQFSNRHYDSILRFFAPRLEKNPHPEGFFLVSRIYFRKNEIRQAIFHVEQAIRLDPGRPSYYYHLAKMYMDTEEYQKAEKAISSAIALPKETNPSYYWLRYRIRKKTNNHIPAFTDLEMMISQKPDYPHYHYLAAMCLIDAEEYGKAFAFLEKAISLDPDNRTYQNRLIQVEEKIEAN